VIGKSHHYGHWAWTFGPTDFESVEPEVRLGRPMATRLLRTCDSPQPAHKPGNFDIQTIFRASRRELGEKSRIANPVFFPQGQRIKDSTRPGRLFFEKEQVMFTRTFSVGRTRVLGRAVSLVLALGLLLSLAGCPMEDDDSTESPDLDPKLVGKWQYSWPGYVSGGTEYPGGYEEYKIEANGEDHILTYGTDYGYGYNISFAGKIVYAYRFSDAAGVIIIEYTAEHKQQWTDYNTTGYPLLDPQPEGNFYGIYYHDLNPAGTQVFFANTSDQKNSNGPTEEKTREKAIEKFSSANMNDLIMPSEGYPVSKLPQE
jgi:hypothetical protein